ncbi:chemotaxis protein CheX [Candidatus Poribacteria bacterium]|nr:chemotaxis protein CheX [Candidatus Poribacteria bacterium]
MKVEFINPFIESVHKLFTTMLGCEAKRADAKLTRVSDNPRQITALIGLSGTARGTVALSFPMETAVAMANRLLGADNTVSDDSVSDAVGELVNIVAGGAKAMFCTESSVPIDLSLPNVIRGERHTVEFPSDAMWLDVPFTSDLGPFNLRVAFEMNGRKRRDN